MHPKPPDCTWKWTHGAKILPFLPQKACMGRKCRQQRGLLRAFGEKGTHTARFLPDGPRSAAMQGKGCEVLWGGAVGDAAGGRATRQVAAPTGWAWRARRDEDATLVGAGQARRWRAWRCGDATLAGSVAIASWHVVAWARAWQRWRAERDVGRRDGRDGSG